MGPEDIDVVILNWQTAPFAVEAALSALRNYATSVVVVDNHSKDDSISVLESALDGRVKILTLSRNYGYAGGNNRGARLGRRPLLLFMNADVYLHEGCLSEMVRIFNQNPFAACVAPALFYPDGKPQASSYHFITPWRIFKIMFGIDRLGTKIGLASLSGNIDLKRNGSFTGETETLYGPCIMVLRVAFDQVGGFDEDFFMYCEETDLIYRLYKMGWKAYRVAEAKAIHNHASSSEQVPLKSYVTMQRSIQIYAKKHFGLLGRFSTYFSSVIGISVRFIFSIMSHNRSRNWAGLRVWLGMAQDTNSRKIGDC